MYNTGHITIIDQTNGSADSSNLFNKHGMTRTIRNTGRYLVDRNTLCPGKHPDYY